MDTLQIMCNTLVQKYAKLSDCVQGNGNIRQYNQNNGQSCRQKHKFVCVFSKIVL